MPKIPIDLPRSVAARHRAEIERRLYFASPHITGFTLVEDAGVISRIVLEADGQVAERSLADGIRRMIERDVLRQRQPPTAPIWQRTPERAPASDVYGELLARELAVELGPGQVALAEPLITLVGFFDRALRRLALEEAGACEYRYPTLLPATVLNRTGYLASFPHLVMYVTWLHTDLDTYREFLADHATGEQLDTAVLGRCGEVSSCLPPTMCFHTYGQFAGRQLGPPGHRVVTARGKAFRFESRYARSLERLWDFTIREIVFLGGQEYVLQRRRHLMERVFALMEQWGLGGLCQVANDPFFGDSDTAARIWAQRMLELKYELRLDIAPDQTVAVGSFNYHDDLFGRAFDIRHDEQHGNPWVHSACAGFGLERLAYALVCQFGTDPDGWPAAVRAGTVA